MQSNIRINQITIYKMLESAATDFSEYVKVDMVKQLGPIENSIDDMLMRLEEFETMVILVQKERGNVVGLTGTLSQVLDKKDEVESLCNKVDVLESLVLNVRETLDSLEEQIDTLEEQSGVNENSSLRNFFMPKLFKKTPENKVCVNKGSIQTFKTDEYFIPTDSEAVEEK